MKTAILTFNNELNYGAILQAFALQKYIKKYSDVYIMNFSFELGHTSLPRKIVEFPKRKKFYSFKKKHIQFSKNKINNYLKFKETINDYDIAIVGSDQVWAFDIINDKKNIFFLKDIDNIRKCSYAASFGKNDNYINNKIEVKNYLSSFDSISIREKSSSDLLMKDGINNVSSVDPTLLLSADDYIKELNLSKNDKKYILVYMLVIDEKLINLANQIGKMLDLKIYCFNNKNRFGKRGVCIPNASPKDFVEMFYNASFVITNSFHGTCFSTIFNKKFISVVHPTRGIRQLDMLNRLGLSDRIYDENKDLSYYVKNDINCSKSFLNNISESKKYIDSIYKGEK